MGRSIRRAAGCDTRAACGPRVFKAHLPEGAETVRQRAEANELDVGVVVTRATGVVVQTTRHAVVCHHAQKRCGHDGGVNAADEMIAFQFDFQEMLELFFVSGKNVIEIFE